MDLRRCFFLMIVFFFNACLPQPLVEEKLGEWDVVNGSLTNRVIHNQALVDNAGMTDESAEKLWTDAVHLFPSGIINRYVSKFELMTDGENEMLAGVNPTDETNRHWVFALDVADSGKLGSTQITLQDDIAHTLIHEFGHILTLNDSQIEPTDMKFQENDERYLTREGLAFPDSYINRFVIEFWNGDLLDEWDQIQRIKNEEVKLEELSLFHRKYPERFITEYAAESPEEDIAESWYYFVAVNEQPAGSIENEKIAFFFDFPELMAIRDHIRKAIK